MLSSLAFSYPTPYPSNRLNKATNFKTMFDTTLLPYNQIYKTENPKCYVFLILRDQF